MVYRRKADYSQFFEENDKKIKEEIKNNPSLKDNTEELISKIIKRISAFGPVDLGVINFNESLYDKNDSWADTKKYMVACEIKDSSTGDYQNLVKIIRDIVKLYILKLCGYCDAAYMIFIDTLPRKEIKEKRKEIFDIGNGNINFRIIEKLKPLFDRVKLFYYYLPRDEKQIGEYEIKNVDNVTIFSMKNMIRT